MRFLIFGIFSLFSSLSFAQYNGCLLLAVNQAQRIQFSQPLQVPGFQAGCLVQEIDDQTMYYWNGNAYEPIASTAGVGGVESLNSITGIVNLVGGAGISIAPSGQNITISATGGGGGVTSVTASLPLLSSGGLTPNISETQSSSSANGWLSSIDWNTFNNKLGVFYVAGTVYVATNGNDTTCVISRFDLPCATITKGEQLAAAQASYGNIWTVNVGPGTYTETPTLYPFVVINGENPSEQNNITPNESSAAGAILNFNGGNPTLDSSWGNSSSGQIEGGFQNIFIYNTTTTTFDFSSFDAPIAFIFVNSLVQNQVNVTGPDYVSGNSLTLIISNTSFTSTLVFDTGYLVINGGYFGDVIINSTGNYQRVISYCLTGTVTGLDIEGTGTLENAMANFGCNMSAGGVTLNGPNADYVASADGIPVIQNQEITNGAQLRYGTDASGIGYTPGNPSAWPSPSPPPVSVQQALDTLQSEVGGGSGANATLSNLTSPTAINQNLTFGSGSSYSILTPNQTGSTNSGEINIQTGNTASGTAGLVEFIGGNSTSAQAGSISFAAGNSSTGPGGTISFSTGTGSTTGFITMESDGGINLAPNAGPNPAALNFYEGGGNFYVGLQAAPSLSATGPTWSLPKTDGTSGQAIITDGATNLSFGTPKAPSGTICGWYDSVATSLIVACQGDNPNTTCPTGYTQKTTTGAKFCAAN